MLAEGGGQLLGSLFDLGQIDELHVFIAPKLIGGRDATMPLAGTGIDQMAAAWQLEDLAMRQLGDDVYLAARVAKRATERQLDSNR